MQRKDIDVDFFYYGIKRYDMQLIESFSIENNVDFYWLRDYVLKEYHAQKNDKDKDLDIEGVKKIIKNALKKVK